MKRVKFLTFIIITFSIIFIIPVTSIGDVNNNDTKSKTVEAYINLDTNTDKVIEQNDTIDIEYKNENSEKIVIEQKNIRDDLIKNNNINSLEYDFKNIEKYEDYLIYKITYPIFNNNSINEKVYNHIKLLAENFKTEFSSYEPTSIEDKLIFKLDTDIGVFKDNILSVKFTIERNYNTYPNPIKFYETYIIDIKENKEINVEDILNKGYEDLFYIASKEYFFNTYGINITKQSENYNDIKPDKNVYKKIFIKDDIVEIFIYDYKKQEETLIKIPMDKLMPYVKKEYIETTQTTTETTTIIETTTETTTIVTEQTSTETTTNINEDTQNSNYNKRKIDKNKPMIALTFDDGPNNTTTNRILDILEQNNSVATFFVVSRRIEKDTETLKRMDSLGCQIGNHTANHKDLTKLSNEQIKSEIDIVNDKLEKEIEKKATMVRVPYGAINQTIKDTLSYPIIMWNVDTKDWQSKNAKSVEQQVLGKVKDGDIILMHDLYSTTADACEVIIPKLIEQGFQLVTVEELLEYKGVDIENGNTYFNVSTK